MTEIDTAVDRTPTASDLGYVSGNYCTAEMNDGAFVLFDGPIDLLSGETYIRADDGYVLDVEDCR
jgi:hypothetical protein